MHRPPAFASTLRAHTRTDTVASRATERFPRPSIDRPDLFRGVESPIPRQIISRFESALPSPRARAVESISRRRCLPRCVSSRDTPVHAIASSRRRVNEPFRVSVPKTTVNSCATYQATFRRSQVCYCTNLLRICSRDAKRRTASGTVFFLIRPLASVLRTDDERHVSHPPSSLLVVFRSATTAGVPPGS